MTTTKMRYGGIFPAGLLFSLSLIVLGFLLDDPAGILDGLWIIVQSESSLITDYIALAGPGAAFVNAGLVTAVSMLLLHFSGDHLNGASPMEIGLMSGFALFGKNIVNIWPIIIGAYLYARLIKREHFGNTCSVALLATALAPVSSFIAHGSGWSNLGLGAFVGIGIGFVIAPLGAHTFKIQNGMNLYNMGFACGLMAMMLVPLMSSMGQNPETTSLWATGYNLPLGIYLGGLCLVLIVIGLFFSHHPPWAAWAGYRRLLTTSGRAPSDFLRMCDSSAVLINMGVNGLIGMGVILAIGGDLNGPTLGGIFAIMGFSSCGKHAFNILPVMAGVVLASLVMTWNLNDHAVQLAILFGTTLAPISGHFGWPYGVLAGFLHSCVVLLAGTPVEGLNLYNNGFAGGLVAIVLYPIITSIVRHSRPELQDAEYLDLFDEDTPILPKRKGEE